jgi:hypothetical protein
MGLAATTEETEANVRFASMYAQSALSDQAQFEKWKRQQAFSPQAELPENLAYGMQAVADVRGWATFMAKWGSQAAAMLTTGGLAKIAEGGLAKAGLTKGLGPLAEAGVGAGLDALDAATNFGVASLAQQGVEIGVDARTQISWSEAGEQALGAGAGAGVFSFGLRGLAANVATPASYPLRVLNPTICFLAGTLVSTEDGEKPIEEIRPGEQVLLYNEQTGEAGYRAVTRLMPSRTETVCDVTWETASPDGGEEQTVHTTPTHPFFVQGEGWVSAIALSQMDELLTDRGEGAVVQSVTCRGDSEPTYNFEVEGWHTYFVGEAAGAPTVLVHNACPPEPVGVGFENLIETEPVGFAGTEVPNGRTWEEVPVADPRSPRLPSDGTWTGTPGDSEFIPNNASRFTTDPRVVNVAPGTRIPFRNGDAVLDKFAWDEFTVEGLTGARGGARSDRRLMLDALTNRYGMASRNEAAQYLRDRFLALHHAGGNRVQLIPGGIHGWTGNTALGVPHRGSASLRRSQ